MLSFLASTPKRHPQSHLRTITTEDGHTTVQFFPQPTSTDTTPATHAMRTRLPPGTTIHSPPYHWHKYQIESFTIEKGCMRATVNGTTQLIPAGNTVTIEPGVYHTFANASALEELVVLTGLDPLERERDEAFFRNLYCYLDDCRKAEMRPSVFQVCLWLHMFDCYLALPGPREVSMMCSEWLVWILGVLVGSWLLGYQISYPEYYAGDVSKLHRRIEDQAEEKVKDF